MSKVLNKIDGIINKIDNNKKYDLCRRYSEIVALLPKTDLHLHLDGSLTHEFIIKNAPQKGLTFTDDMNQDIRVFLMNEKMYANKNDTESSQISKYILPKYASSNWKVFDFCNQFLQTKANLMDATYSLTVKMALDYNVKVIEIRFCPTLHIVEGLSEDEVIQSVIDGYRNAQNDLNDNHSISIKGGIILCILRNFDLQHAYNVLELTKKYLNNGVVGMDIAGDEGNYELSIFKDVLFKANTENIPMTVHAGEWVQPELKCERNIELCCEYDNIKRIGHGLTITRDIDLMKLVKQQDKSIECCLTGNCGFGKKIKAYRLHPSSKMVDMGLNITLNCDNLLLSGDHHRIPTPNNEIYMFKTELNMSWKDIKNVLMNGVKYSFDKSINEQWIKNFENQIDSIFQKYNIH